LNQLAPIIAAHTPVLVTAAGQSAQTRFWEFFAAQIRNRHTRRAYAQATREFLVWCERAGVATIADVKPLHVAAYIEQLGRERSAPTVKQRLAAIRHLFDWLVTGQVMPVNPAASVRGLSHSVKRGKTPLLVPPRACILGFDGGRDRPRFHPPWFSPYRQREAPVMGETLGSLGLFPPRLGCARSCRSRQWRAASPDGVQPSPGVDCGCARLRW